MPKLGKNIERDVELSHRIYNRNVPNKSVQMYFDPRAVDTRFQRFPMFDKVKQQETNIATHDHFYMGVNFLPGNGGPYEGMSGTIDKESELKNLYFPLQSAPQSKYFPSSTSDMYMIQEPNNTNPYPNKYQLLGKTDVPTNQNKNPYDLGYKQFFNHTRQQIKEL
jgi:hypothetical protein